MSLQRTDYVPIGYKVFGLSPTLFPIMYVQVSAETKHNSLGDEVHLVNVVRGKARPMVIQVELTDAEVQAWVEHFNLVPA